MFIYATKLLWGIYKEGQLVDCFICREDTLVNVEEAEIIVPEGPRFALFTHCIYQKRYCRPGGGNF